MTRPVSLDRPRPRRRWPVVLGCVAGFAILASLLLIRVLRDPLPVLDEPTLTAAWQQWQAYGPTSYNLTLQLEGARPGPVHIEVRNRQVTAMTRDGRTPRQRRTWEAWTVESQFDMMRRELEMAADPAGEMGTTSDSRLLLGATFHPRLGYPTRFRRIAIGGGPDVSWRVTKFQVAE